MFFPFQSVQNWWYISLQALNSSYFRLKEIFPKPNGAYNYYKLGEPIEVAVLQRVLLYFSIEVAKHHSSAVLQSCLLAKYQQ